MSIRYLYVIGALLFSALIVGACGGGSVRDTSNTVYGMYISESSAGANLTKTELQTFFESQVVCYGIGDLGPITTLTCDKNTSYVNSDSIFGLSTTNRRVNNFVTKTESGIYSISRDQLIYTAPGAPYLFAGGATSNETVSGLVLLPRDSSGNILPSNQIKGVLLYFHQTVISKAGVPSGYGNQSSADNENSNHTQNLLAAIYANSGYIVIAPDYVGQGINTLPVHPYVLLPQNDALSGIYMLSALKTYLAKKGIDLREINNSIPNLYISSYSEGGAYAVWASRLIQNDYANIVHNAGLQLARTVGVSGAYDLTGAMLPFAFSNTTNGIESGQNPYNVSPGCDPANPGFSQTVCSESTIQRLTSANAQLQLAFGKPPLSTYMVNALITYDYTDAAYNLVMHPSYAQQSTCINPVSLASGEFVYQSCASVPVSDGGAGGDYTAQTIFNLNGLSADQINTQLIAAAAGTSGYLINNNTSFAQVFSALAEGNPYNSVATFIYTNLLQDYGIMSFIAAANVYDWSTSSPISLIYMRYDSVVTNLDSKSACSTNASSLFSNSAAGLVTCIQDAGANNESPTQGVNNANLWTVTADLLPIYLNHTHAEGILQIAALAQIESTTQ